MLERKATFAERLRELLNIKGLTQIELSRMTGIERSNISHYLRGSYEGKSKVVYAIAKATGVNEAWLMGLDVPMEKAATDNSDGVPDRASLLVKMFDQLSPEGQEAVLQALVDQLKAGK